MDLLKYIGFPKKSKDYAFKAKPRWSSSSHYDIYVKRPGDRFWHLCYDGEELDSINKHQAINYINIWCDNPDEFDKFIQHSQQIQKDKVVIISQASRRMDDALD